MKKLAVIITIGLCAYVVQAQDLKRIGTIGASFIPVNDSIARASGLKNAGGLQVSKVNGLTAEALKLMPGDILLKINGVEIPSAGYQKILADKKVTRFEGDLTTWEIWRNGQPVTLKGKVAGKPKETSESFETIYDQFAFGDGQIRCIITKPSTPGKKPAILSIQGYPCSSVDMMPAWHPGKQIADEFTRRGYVVMRAEKPGIGDSNGSLSCYDIDFPTEVAAFREAFRKMKSLPDVDTSNLFIFGHSMGGMEAPFIAPDVDPKGIIVYGVVTKGWYEYLLDMLRYQNPNLGIGHLQTEKEMRTWYPLLYDIFVNRKKPSELVEQHPEYRRLLERDMEYAGGDHLFSRSLEFSLSLNDMNVAEAWSRVDCHVLSAYGAYDIQVVNDFGHREIVEIVNTFHPGKATYVEFPKTDHLLLEHKKEQDKWDIYNIPGMIPKLCQEYGISIKAMNAFDDWMKQLMK